MSKPNRCKGKVGHPTWISAMCAASRTPKDPVAAYKCSYCKKWHVGKVTLDLLERYPLAWVGVFGQEQSSMIKELIGASNKSLRAVRAVIHEWEESALVHIVGIVPPPAVRNRGDRR